MRRGAMMAVVAIALGATGPSSSTAEQAAHWREISWPFPRDGWPAGRAFRCEGTCAGAELYVRAKRGFCNCDRGVADDDEVDRVADVDLISPRFAPAGPGEVVRIGNLQGRARRYDLGPTDGVRSQAVGIALSRGCDLLVAVVQARDDVIAVQRAALGFPQTGELTASSTAMLDGK